jgi:hypothetical protein
MCIEYSTVKFDTFHFWLWLSQIIFSSRLEITMPAENAFLTIEDGIPMASVPRSYTMAQSEYATE